jgi:hypothetical protein
MVERCALDWTGSRQKSLLGSREHGYISSGITNAEFADQESPWDKKVLENLVMAPLVKTFQAIGS